MEKWKNEKIWRMKNVVSFEEQNHCINSFFSPLLTFPETYTRGHFLLFLFHFLQFQSKFHRTSSILHTHFLSFLPYLEWPFWGPFCFTLRCDGWLFTVGVFPDGLALTLSLDFLSFWSCGLCFWRFIPFLPHQCIQLFASAIVFLSRR